MKDGARSDQEPENVLIPDVNIQDLHAGKKQKKQQEPSRKKKIHLRINDDVIYCFFLTLHF